MLCVFDFRIVMDSRKLCEPCYRTSKYTFAVKYCSDCEEFLCSECAVYHSKFKAFLSHRVVDEIKFVVSEKKAFEYFPLGVNVNLCPAVAAILDFRSA